MLIAFVTRWCDLSSASGLEYLRCEWHWICNQREAEWRLIFWGLILQSRCGDLMADMRREAWRRVSLVSQSVGYKTYHLCSRQSEHHRDINALIAKVSRCDSSGGLSQVASDTASSVRSTIHSCRAHPAAATQDHMRASQIAGFSRPLLCVLCTYLPCIVSVETSLFICLKAVTQPEVAPADGDVGHKEFTVTQARMFTVTMYHEPLHRDVRNIYQSYRRTSDYSLPK